MRYIQAFSIVTFLCTSAWAQRIVVQSGPYKMVYENEKSATRAKLITDHVTFLLRDRGIEVIEDGECDDKACLEAAREKHNTDEALYVRTEQTDARYLFEIVWAKSEGSTVETTGAFSSALETLSEELKPQLARLTATAPETEKERRDEKEKVAAVTPVRKAEPAQAPSETNKLPRSALIAALASTCAVGIGALTVDIIVKERYEKLKSGKESTDYWHKTRALQIADYALLGLTAGGVVTSVVFILVTDLKKKSRDTKTSAFLSPYVTDNSAMMVLNRSF